MLEDVGLLMLMYRTCSEVAYGAGREDITIVTFPVGWECEGILLTLAVFSIVLADLKELENDDCRI